MIKKLISIVLVLMMIVSLVAVCSITSSAAADSLVIKVGGKNYTAKVGDTATYTISFKYSKARVATAQVELPVNFSLLTGYTNSQLDENAADCFPGFTTDYYARYDSANSFGLVGYVVNFASVSGYDFSAGKVVMTLPFTVKAGGTMELKSKVRYVADPEGNDIIDDNYRVADSSFVVTEKLEVSSPSTGVNIKGKLESYLSDTDKVTITATADGKDYTTEVNGGAAEYSLQVPANKTYTLSVAKKNHVTREYTVAVKSSDFTQDVKICPRGDANMDGKVKINDVNAAYKHVLGTKPIEDPYAFQCADVKTNGSIKINDVNAIYKHVLGTVSLFDP